MEKVENGTQQEGPTLYSFVSLHEQNTLRAIGPASQPTYRLLPYLGVVASAGYVDESKNMSFHF